MAKKVSTNENASLNKKEAFENYLAILDKNIDKNVQELSTIEIEFNYVNDEFNEKRSQKDALKKKLEEKQNEVHTLIMDFHKIFHTGFDSWNPDLIQQSEISEIAESDDETDDWDNDDESLARFLGDVDTAAPSEVEADPNVTNPKTISKRGKKSK
jgi:predicted nuclease with TOPRIM domain